jgi:hypothetical protein
VPEALWRASDRLVPDVDEDEDDEEEAESELDSRDERYEVA